MAADVTSVQAHAPSAQGAVSARRLRVLHLEDNEADQALAASHLQRAGLWPEVLRIDRTSVDPAKISPIHNTTGSHRPSKYPMRPIPG